MSLVAVPRPSVVLAPLPCRLDPAQPRKRTTPRLHPRLTQDLRPRPQAKVRLALPLVLSCKEAPRPVGVGRPAVSSTPRSPTLCTPATTLARRHHPPPSHAIFPIPAPPRLPARAQRRTARVSRLRPVEGFGLTCDHIPIPRRLDPIRLKRRGATHLLSVLVLGVRVTFCACFLGAAKKNWSNCDQTF